jgi:hypothetical protein
MSISLLIELKESSRKEARLVPIATEQIFSIYWQPACDILDLKWITLFQSGLPIDNEEERRMIVSELSQLKLHFVKDEQVLDRSAIDHIISRIDDLTREIMSISDLDLYELYIG